MKVSPASRVHKSTRALASMIAIATMSVGMAGCAIAPVNSPRSAAPLAVDVTPEHGDTAAWPSDTLTVSATGGTVNKVTATSAGGASVIGGELAGTIWTPERAFLPDTAYTVTIDAVNDLGEPATMTDSFTTLKPGITATYTILYSGNNRGIGIPVTIKFDSAVATDEQKAAVEKAARVSTTPAQPGSWGWLNNQTMMYRSATYWQAGTIIHLDAAIGGLQTGDDKWIGADDSATYTISAKNRLLKVSTSSHQMTAWEDGQLVKNLPVTTGQAGMESRTGVKVISERYATKVLDSSTVGIDNDSSEGWLRPVQYAQRLTWTGEFIHSADWSASSHGKANVSHGCTGLTTSRAKWVYNFTVIGTPVEYTGNKRTIKQHEGLALWTLSWDEWQELSATI